MTIAPQRRGTGRTLTLPAPLWLLFLLLLPACGDDLTEENALTVPFIRANVEVRDTVIEAASSSTFRQFIPMNGRVNLVGRSGDYVGIMALQFFPTLFPNRDTIEVIEATLTLRAVSWFGDSSGTLTFTTHKILRSWSQTTLTWDSTLTGFYESTSRGSSSFSVAGDTGSIVISLDTALVREWLRPATITSYGLALVPTSSATVVRGIHPFDVDSTTFYPTLRVVARNVAGTVQDTATYSFGIDTFVGNIDNLNTDPGLLYLQSGVSYRSLLKFNFAGIPRGAIINRAELLLSRDPVTSRLTRFSGDSSVSAHRAVDEETVPGFESRAATGKRMEGTSATYTFDIRYMVQSWVKGPNFGLLLRAPNQTEFSSFDLFTFHNETASSPSLRPRISITYTYEKN